MSLFLCAALRLYFCGELRLGVSIASSRDLVPDVPKWDACSSVLSVLAHQFVAVHGFGVGCNWRNLAAAGRRDKLRYSGCGCALRLDRLRINLIRWWQSDPLRLRK